MKFHISISGSLWYPDSNASKSRFSCFNIRIFMLWLLDTRYLDFWCLDIEFALVSGVRIPGYHSYCKFIQIEQKSVLALSFQLDSLEIWISALMDKETMEHSRPCLDTNLSNRLINNNNLLTRACSNSTKVSIFFNNNGRSPPTTFKIRVQQPRR